MRTTAWSAPNLAAKGNRFKGSPTAVRAPVELVGHDARLSRQLPSAGKPVNEQKFAGLVRLPGDRVDRDGGEERAETHDRAGHRGSSLVGHPSANRSRRFEIRSTRIDHSATTCGP